MCAMGFPRKRGGGDFLGGGQISNFLIYSPILTGLTPVDVPRVDLEIRLG